MTVSELKKTILTFLVEQRLAIVATVHPNISPEAAVVQFAVTENLEIIFNTFTTYRKYKNLQTNPAVALVIGGEENITVQYEGIARELVKTDEEYYKSIFLKNIRKLKNGRLFPKHGGSSSNRLGFVTLTYA